MPNVCVKTSKISTRVLKTPRISKAGEQIALARLPSCHGACFLHLPSLVNMHNTLTTPNPDYDNADSPASTGCFTITVKSNFSSFMTFFDVWTIPMPFLCVPGWDIYVFSHETSETVENIWLTNYFWSGPKKPVFLTISGL